MTLLVAPIEALTDSLLSDPERRVLLALFSFRAKNTENVYPKLPALAERSLIKDHTRISKITTSLAKKGWLTKKKRGFTGCNQYFLTVPERLGGDTAIHPTKTLIDEPATSGRKASKLYLVTDGEAFKVGITTMPIIKRLGALQTASHKEIKVVFCAECKDAEGREKAILRDYSNKIISGEWMSLSRAEVERLTVQEGSQSNLDWYTNLDWHANLAPSANSNLDCNANTNLDGDTKYREQTIEQTIEQTKSEKFTEVDYLMAEAIHKAVLTVSPKAKTPDFKKWADDIRLMRERDGHSQKEICEVFNWANNDPFWKTNILSTSKLREKFAALHTKMINGGSNAAGQPNTQSRGTPAQRAKALRESKQKSDGSVVGCDVGDLRPQVGEQIRIGADNGVD